LIALFVRSRSELVFLSPRAVLQVAGIVVSQIFRAVLAE